MKKQIFLIMILIISQSLSGQEIASAGISDAPTGQLRLFPTHPKGINKNQASHLIEPTEFQDCGDVLFDKEYGPVCRGGNLQSNTDILSTATVRFLHEYPKINGNKYVLALSSNVLAYSANGVSFTTLLSTVSLSAKMWAVNYNDICYLGFNNWNRWKFDGTTLFGSTTTPQIKYGIIYKDKIVGINVNETSGKSKLVYSDVGYPDIWPSINYIYVDRDDGDELTGIKAYRGNLYVFKKKGIYQMVGLDDGYPTNDGYYKIVDGIGCLYNETIQEKDGYLCFVSERGVELFDGINVTLVSSRITPEIKNLAQMYTGTLSWGETTADDFADGEIVNVDTTTVPGSIWWWNAQTSTTTISDAMQYTSIALDSKNYPHIASCDDQFLKYSSFTSAGWKTSVVDSINAIEFCSLKIDSNNNPHISYSYNDNSNISLKYSSHTSEGWVTSIIEPVGIYRYTSLALDSNNNPSISYWDQTNKDLKYSSYTSVGWSTSTIDSVGEVGQANSIAIDSNNNPHISYYDYTNSKLKYSSHTSVGWAISTVASGNGKSSIAINNNNEPCISYYYNFLKYSSHTSSGWYTSTVDNISFVGQDNSIAIDSNNKPHIAYTSATSSYDLKYTSWTGTAWSISTLDSIGDVGLTPSLELNNNNIPHISYIDHTNFKLKHYTPINDTYISSKFNGTTTDNNWLGWQTFQVTESLPIFVTLNYYTRTATSESGLDTANWISLNNNEYSKSNDGSWIQYKFKFISAVANISARIDNVSIDYGVDSQNKPLLGFVSDRRYWLAGAIKPEINNNVVYVLDQNNNWTKFNNMHVGSFVKFKDDMYWGASTDVFQINKYSEDYTTDNGAAITPFIKTKDYDFDTFINDKYFSDLWVYAEPSVVFSTMTVSFYLNKQTTAKATESISLLANGTYPNSSIISKIRNSADRWRYINFKVSNFNKFYGLLFKYGYHSEGNK